MEDIKSKIQSRTQNTFIEKIILNGGTINPCPDDIDILFQKMKYSLLGVYNGKVGRWFQAMDLFDRQITTHTLRVTALSLQLGRVLGLGNDDLNYIQYGTLLHDVGKLGIPDAIIQKPGKLTPQEYEIVQRHPIYAHEWISMSDDFLPSKVIPLYHHEKWDGTGYPHRLKGEEIPLLARVVAVIDVWDALTSDRPYRRAMSNQQAIDIIKSETGTHFDPEISEAFISLGIHEKQSVSYDRALIL